MSDNISVRDEAMFLTAIARLEATAGVGCQSKDFANILTFLQKFARVKNSQEEFREAALISEQDFNSLRTFFTQLTLNCSPQNVSKGDQAKIVQCKILLSLVSAGPAGQTAT